MVAARVNANDKGDHLLLPPETEEAGPCVISREQGTRMLTCLPL